MTPSALADVASIVELFDLDGELAAAVGRVFAKPAVGQPLPIPRAAVRSLLERGIIEEGPDGPRPRAMAAIEEVGWQWREDQASRLWASRRLDAEMQHAHLIGLAAPGSVELIGERSHRTLNEAFAELVGDARELLNAFPIVGPRDVRDGWRRDAEPAVVDANTRAVERGVKTVNVIDRPRLSQFRERHTLVDVTPFTAIVGDIPLRIAVIDRSTTVLPVSVHYGASGMLVVRSRMLARVATSLIMSVASTPLRSSPGHLGDLESRVLTLLAAGAKDEVIARRLGVSDRTVRRAIAAMMVDFDVVSRFQLALRVARLGLI
ncbi:MAG: hypothetical protein QOF57_297 [Frankiaceae bacterium]|nr:hypothetical protein [Frankiaceae bacterium]